MSSIIVVFGAAVAVLGSIGVIRPTRLIRLVETPWRSPTGLYLAIAVRLLLGVVLVVAAPDCRFPRAVRILGIVTLISAAATTVLGYERARSFVEWWAGRPSGFIRGWSVVAVAFGSFLVYAAF